VESVKADTVSELSADTPKLDEGLACLFVRLAAETMEPFLAALVEDCLGNEGDGGRAVTKPSGSKFSLSHLSDLVERWELPGFPALVGQDQIPARGEIVNHRDDSRKVVVGCAEKG
jgi:hypothetical protein